MKEYVLKLQSLPLFVANQEAVWGIWGRRTETYWASWLLLVDFYVRGCMYDIFGLQMWICCILLDAVIHWIIDKWRLIEYCIKQNHQPSKKNPTNLKTVNSCSEFLQQLDSDYDWIGLRLLSKQAQIHLKMKMHTKGQLSQQALGISQEGRQM